MDEQTIREELRQLIAENTGREPAEYVIRERGFAFIVEKQHYPAGFKLR